LGVQNNVTVDQAATAEAAQGYSLNDLIDAQPELSTLRALLDQAGFADALGGGGEFTLFAPTNDAFAAISDQVAALQNDPEALKAVLRYHLLVGAQDSATISASSSLPTQLDEQSIGVDASGGSILLNGSVTLLVGDAAARNGVMHIVSSVLLPQEAAAEFPEDNGAALGLAPNTFASGGSDLTDAGKIELDKVAAFLLQTPGDIEIGGHTDADGEPGFNQTLSQQRSNAVKTYLEAQGIAAETMTAVGFGEDQPIAPNDTPENKSKNRRIVFRPI
jgi:flagellar motor protein MotB